MNQGIGNQAHELEIFVNLNEKTEPVYVIANSPINSIRPLIEEVFRISIEGYSLLYDEKALMEDESFQDYRIQDGDVIHLLNDKPDLQIDKDPGDEIYIKMPDGSNLTLKFSSSSTVGALKAEIAKLKGIPVDQQMLYYSSKEMQNAKLLSDYELGKESTIHLILQEEADLFVKISTGEETHLKVISSQTVQDLKEKIYKQFGILPKEQTVLHAGKSLEDQVKLSECNLQNDTSVFVKIRERLIHVIPRTTDGQKKGRIQMQPSDTVKQLKEQVEKITGIAFECQILAYNGNSLQDERNLSDYGLEDNSVVTVLKTKSIKIKVNNLSGDTSQAFSIEVYTDESIKKLKEIIKKKNNIDVDSQMLIFKGDELDDAKTVSECKIIDNSEIYVARTSDIEHFFWKDEHENLYVMQIESSSPIREIKDKLQKKWGVPLDKVRAISNISSEVSSKISGVNSESVIDQGFISAFL